jgi:Zn-dependent peptidase ImmA (M78 family)
MSRLLNFTEIRKQAQKVLKDNRVQKPPVNLGNIAKRLGITVKYEPFEEDISGVLYRDQQGTIIGVNSFHHPNRQRFTIAHEIGHFVLHEMDVHVDKGYRMVFRNSKSSRADDPLEIAANWFAAELLMPAHMLRPEVEQFIHDFEDGEGLRNLARRYHVSTQAMAFRLANLGLLPE